MVWKPKQHWIGPQKVIIQEDHNVIWTTMSSRLFKVAPEHVRPLSAVEEVQHGKMLLRGDQTESLRNLTTGVTRYENLIGNEIPYSPSLLPSTPENQEIPRQTSNMQPEPEEVPSSERSSEDRRMPASRAPSLNEDPEILPVDEAANVPVPEDDDADLFCDDELEHLCFATEPQQVWKHEVSLPAKDIRNWLSESDPSEMSFIVSAAKKQRAEVKLCDLSPQEKMEFMQAKEKEVQSWLDTGTVKRILRGQVPERNILRCRWILRWKDAETNSHLGANAGSQNQNRKAKARLVVLCFEDPELHKIDRDSPTVTKLSRNLILQTAASQRWTIGSFDIKTAFLRGSADPGRILGLEPPAELRKKMNLNEEEILQLLKGAYGRADAPLLWFKELR